MKVEEYLRAKLEPELRKALEEKSKEELIDSIIDLTVSYCTIAVSPFKLNARLYKSHLASNQQVLRNSFPDWSEATLKGATQCCELNKNFINKK